MKSIDVVPTWYWPDGVPRYLSPPRSTVYKAAVERWARRTPDSPALEGHGGRIDYRTLDERVNRAAARIRRAGGGRGEAGPGLRVAVAPAPGIDGAVAVLGALHAGADTLLVDPATPEAERRAALAAFGCGLLIADDAGGGQHAWGTTSVQSIAHPAPTGRDDPEPPAAAPSPGGRLGFRWGHAVVLQPNAALLGWSLAFRAFAMLEKDERFAVFRPLSTWEGVIGLLAPLVVGATAMCPSGAWEAVLDAAAQERPGGMWLDRAQAEALATDLRARPRRARPAWLYVSVDSPISARTRRRLRRVLGGQVLTALGTPATGPIAGSPRPWLIDEAVGTPMTGVDLFPVDRAAGRLAEPPWPLLASAGVGVKSTLFAPEMSLEGAAPGRFVSEDVLDTGVSGRIDANGFLYLV